MSEGHLPDAAGLLSVAGPPSGAPRPVLLAIDGRSGAGKSTLADALLEDLLTQGTDAVLFRLEDLYPGWHGLAAGIEDYVNRVLAPLSRGATATWNAWDWSTDSPGATRETRPAAVVLCEGVGAAAPAARPYLSAALTLRSPAPLRKARALERDGETYRPFWDTWAEQEEALPRAADRPQDLSLDVTAPGLEERAVAWARAAIATAAPR